MTQLADHPQTVDVPQQDTVLERVLRGAAFLDAKYPGWERCINLYTLCLYSGDDCVLGQLYGTFMSAYKEFDIEVLIDSTWSTELLQHSIAHGFADPTAYTTTLLTTCWSDVIRTRRGQSV